MGATVNSPTIGRYIMNRRRTSFCFRLVIAVAAVVAHAAPAVAQPPSVDAETLRAGRSFLETKVYGVDEDRQVLALFDGLRVADVSDGMDQAGLADVGLVSAQIGPLWRDTEHFTHRIVGIAVTVRYVPPTQPPPAA